VNKKSFMCVRKSYTQRYVLRVYSLDTCTRYECIALVKKRSFKKACMSYVVHIQNTLVKKRTLTNQIAGSLTWKIAPYQSDCVEEVIVLTTRVRRSIGVC
jgi:hypothetical protein